MILDKIKIFFIYIFILFNFSCNKNPVDNKINLSKADAGEDQETYVGSYIEFNPTKSTLIENDVIDVLQYIPDPNNPEEMFPIIESSLTGKLIAGFRTEGIYNFILNISCKNGKVYADEMKVTVKPRQPGLIDDVNLEIQIRYRLKYKEGELNANKLLFLDSLYVDVPYTNSNKIKKLDGIENCTNLVFLSLGLQNITDLTPLKNLINLEVLDLNQNYTIENISPLESLTNLKVLSLYSNPIKNINALSSLTKLTELYILDTPIDDINPLGNLKNLETLYIDGSGTGVNFQDISALANLTKLKELDIADRGITNIKSLENLTELVILGLSYNTIEDISHVYKMKNLVRLYIRKNNIRSLNGIQGLENLDFLDAVDNQIDTIKELEFLPNIHLIGLSGNKIEDISPLVNNKNLGDGVHLYLGRNPLNEKSINEYIPALIARGVKVYMM